MAGERRLGGPGFTLIELIVVLVLIGVLTTVAARRLLALRAEAERTTFGQVVGGLQAAASLELLSLVVAGRDEEIAALDGANPMDWLLDPPATYAGTLRGAEAAEVAPGRWWYDPELRALSYRVHFAERFEGGPAGLARARLRVQLDFHDRNGNGRFDPGLDGVAGARLRPLEPFAWRAAAARRAPG